MFRAAKTLKYVNAVHLQRPEGNGKMAGASEMPLWGKQNKSQQRATNTLASSGKTYKEVRLRKLKSDSGIGPATPLIFLRGLK